MSDLAPFGLEDDRWLGLVREAEHPPALGMLGPYELRAEASRGGQGVVYRAVQPGTHREVALKRLLLGPAAAPDTLRRFEREVESVSALSHPGIVTVHGMEVIEGVPHLVMEWIEGVPLTAWARGRDRREVLRTFLAVLDAVRHAHQRGILHRDLKPSNVLVDERGAPHVLDFGLARREGEATLTASGGFLGTLAYAAPEQVRGGACDARTDVHALGVMLHELLTGRRPWDVSGTLAEAIETIEHEEPRPGQGAELDAILGRALAKEPARRYQSVDALADDLERFLAGEPVRAHPPSALYQLRKLVRRHRAPFAFAATIGALLCAAIVVVSLQAARLRRERDRSNELAGRADALRARAQGVLDFLVQDVLEGADPWLGGADRPVSELLRAASSRVSRRFRAQPEVEAEVLATLGRVFLTSGRLDEAEAHHRRALELRRAAFGERSPEVAESLHSLGWVRVQRHRLADAEPLIRQSLELRTALLPAGHPDLADTLRSLAICREGQGALEEARELYDRSLALYRAIGGGKNSGVADVLLSRAILLHKCGELAEAEAAAREALERRLSFYDAESPAHGNPHLILGRILGDRGAPEEAGRHLRKAVALFRKGGDRSYEADALTLLGELEAGRGNLGEAEERLLQAVEMGRGIDDPQAAALRRISLASVQAQLGDLEGGAKAFQEVVPGLRKRQGLPARQMASILEQYARIQERRGRTEEAEQLRAEAALLLRTPR